MKRSMRASLSFALALVMALALGACAGNTAGNTDDSANLHPAVSDSTAIQYEGALLTAYEQKIVISGSEGDKEFTTSSETLYDTGDMDQMYLDDIVAVTYHVDDAGNHADKIVLVEHMETPLTFAGELVASSKSSITLVDKNLSVTFQIDDDTYIVGDLSKGDKIELTYLGDINEYPYANVVAVVTEAETTKMSTVHGSVSEISGKTMLLALDSAHAYRFTVTDSTKIVGVADHISVGDQVDVTFEGQIESQPTALGIKIINNAPKRAYVINGTVAEVAKDGVTIDTGTAKYAFGTNTSTKFYGESLTKGYLAKITYTGTLGDKPVASIVYCAKSAKDANKATARKQASSEKDESKNEKKDTSKTEKKDEKKETSSSSKTDSSTEKKTEETKAEEQQGTSSSAQTDEKNSGLAGQQATEPESTSSETEQEHEATETESEAATQQDTETEAETEPEGEPSEPEAEATQETTEPEVEETEPEATETETEETEPAATEPTTDEAEPEATETETDESADKETEQEAEATETAATETEETEADADEQDGNEEAKPASDMGISGQGTIVKGDEKKKTVVIKLKNDKEITLTFDKDTKISSGYIPQIGDVVKVEYGSTSMKLKDIQLISRDADAKSDKDDKADASSEAADEAKSADES